MSRELLVEAAASGQHLRESVLLSRALRYAPPERIARQLKLPVEQPSAPMAQAARDRKQRVSLPPQSPWPVGEARDLARKFLAQHGIGDAAAVPQSGCYSVCRQIILSALSRLADEDLPFVTEALVRQLSRADCGQSLRDKLMNAVVDRAGSDRVSDSQAVRLVSGVLRALSREPSAVDVAVQAMARRAFTATLSAFQSQVRRQGNEGKCYDPARLQAALGALATAAGGSRIDPVRFEALLGVIDEMLPYAGDGPRHPVRPEDLALVLRHVCQKAGGAALPAGLRELALVKVCSPRLPYSSALRGAMVFQLGMALRLWDQPSAVQRSLLAMIAGAAASQPGAKGLTPDEIGTMAWALGLHLVGDPVAQKWHRTYEHIVHGSSAPDVHVMMALAKLADAVSWQRLEEGLMAVVPGAVLDASKAIAAQETPAEEAPLSLPAVLRCAD